MHKCMLVIASAITVIGVFISCSKGNTGTNNNTVDCSTVTNKTWAADVEPIIQSICNQAGCHASGSVNGPGPLTSYNQVISAKTQIREAIRTGLMPQNTTLTQAQKNSIICWIDSGALNN